MRTWNVHTLDGESCIATWDRVLISVYRARMGLPAVDQMQIAARNLLATQPSGTRISFLSVVERTSPPPGDDVRNALSDFFRSHDQKMAEVILVPEGGGFRSSLVRGVGLALSRLAPRSLPFKFSDSVGAACQLIAPHLSPAAGGAMGLERIVDEIRREVALKADGG